jgi:hypothetical protein
VPLAILAIGVAAPVPASALQNGQRCKVADDARYERHGYACVKARGGEYRLAAIVAEPAIRPLRHSG